MAKVWAQKWLTNTSEIKFSLHIHKDQIKPFGHEYNEDHSNPYELHEDRRPYPTNVTPEFYTILQQSRYGRLIDWKPM
jgi:hypothetical protein